MSTAINDYRQTSSSERSAVTNDADRESFDQLQYLEAKLILKPDRFTSLKTFRHFGKVVQRTAEKLEVGSLSDPGVDQHPQVREIVFGDTPDFRLYNNAFILRRRTKFEDGFPVGDPEVVFKFRHPDLRTAAAVDVRPNIAGNSRIKFKVEALPLHNEIGGFRFLYSHNCVFGLSQMHNAEKTSIQTLAEVFPALASLTRSGEEKVVLVSNAIIEEVLLELGELKFGKGITAKYSVALWRTRGEHLPLVGEFSYQVKFDRDKPIHDAARKRCEQFFVTLQFDAKDWILLGTTKTGMVYRMKGNPPQRYE